MNGSRFPNIINSAISSIKETFLHNYVYIFYEETIDNYKKFYETKKGYDTKFLVGEKQNIKEFHVHSFISFTETFNFLKYVANR